MCKIIDLTRYKINKLEKVISNNQDKLELGIEIYNKAVEQFEKDMCNFDKNKYKKLNDYINKKISNKQ